MPNLIDQWKALCINYLLNKKQQQNNKNKNDATTNCCTPNPSCSGASKTLGLAACTIASPIEATFILSRKKPFQ